MKLPNKVSIGSEEIQVTRDKSPKVDDKECFGYWSEADGLICIQEGLPPGRTLNTFIHELVEAINDTTELGLKHRQIQALGLLLSQAMLPMLDERQHTQLLVPKNTHVVYSGGPTQSPDPHENYIADPCIRSRET